MIRHAMDISIVEAQKDQQSLNGHIDLVKAIENKDMKNAEIIMENHLNMCQKIMDNNDSIV